MMCTTNEWHDRFRPINTGERRRDPGLPELQPVLFAALYRYPEASQSVREALHDFATKWYAQPV